MALPSRQRRRAAIAFVLAPIAAAVALTFLAWLITLAAHLSAPLPSLMRGWAITAGILLSAMLTLGWGYHAMAFRQRWRSAPSYILACGGFGVAAAIVVTYFFLRSRSVIANPTDAIGAFIAASLLIAPPGALMGWVFWLIRRPDRDQESDPLQVFD